MMKQKKYLKWLEKVTDYFNERDIAGVSSWINRINPNLDQSAYELQSFLKNKLL